MSETKRVAVGHVWPLRRVSAKHIAGAAVAVAAFGLGSTMSVPATAQGRSAEALSRFGIQTVSTKPDRVSGGNVLVEITYPGNARKAPLPIKLNGQDISGAFAPGKAPNSLVGLVTGLALGRNVLAV